MGETRFEKFKNGVINSIGFIVVGAVVVVFMAKNFVEIGESGKTVSEIIADGIFALVFGWAIKMLLGYQGILSGMNSKKVLDTLNQQATAIKKIECYLPLLPKFCDRENAELRIKRRKLILSKELISYAKIIENVFKGEKDSVETLKQMRKGIKLFEDALAASGEDYLRGKSIERQQEIRKQNNNTDKNETIVPQKPASQMSIREIDGKQVVVVDTDQSLFEGIKKSEYAEMAREYMKEKYRGQTIEGIKFTARSENEYTRSESAVRLQRNNNSAYESKMRAVTELTNFVKTGTFISHETAKHQKGFNVGGYNRYAVTFVLDNVVFGGELLVALNGSGQGMFYDIVKIKENGAGYHPIVAGANTVSNNSIRQNPKKSTESDIKYSLRENIEDDVIKKYGKTYRWAETGYLLKDGSRIDMSGRNEGAPGGYRTVDHRDIFYDIDGSYGTDAMVEFMQRGNIRVMPEQPGINLQIEPTEAQYRQIQNLVETLGWKNKEFSVDFDNANGDTIDNLYYEGNMSARKVISDIQYYFKEGKTPYQSELSKFRYSLRENATDSEGRKLSKKQLEFFKDSKVVDENGNLLVVYHGTKSDFTIFDKSKGGESNSIADIGFWFTTSKQGAEQWAENAWWGDNEQGKAMAAYLKIDNPKIYETTDNNSKEVVLKERDLRQKRSKIASKYLYDINRNNSTTGVAEWDAFRVIVENYDKETQSFYLDKLSLDKRENVTHDAEEYKAIYAEEENIGKEISRLHFTRDGYEKFRADLYSLTGQSAEDANFNGNGFALKNAQETKELFVKQLKEQGYDGLIIHTDFDANSFGLHNTQYVVFDANQIKSIDNLNPTENPDIRYSLREKPIFNDKKSKTKLIERLDGMQLDYYGKYFAHIEDASKFFGEDTNADRLATQIIAMANQNDESVRYAYADDLSTAIINNMVVTDVDPQRLSDITGLSDAMRQYMHKLNLTADIMAEVKSKYGEKEARTIRLIWGSAKDASVKISIDDAVSELQSRGYTFQSDNVADQFLEMLDVVEESRNLASRELSKTAKQLLSPEEYDSLHEEIRDDIMSFMEEKGTAKEWGDYVRSAECEANTILEQARQKAEEKTKLATLEAQLAEEKAKHAYDKQIKELEEKIRDAEVSAELRAADDIEYNKEYHRLVDKVWNEAVSLSADNLKKYNNASDLMNKEFASVVKKLAGIKYRGELKKGATRRIIADFGKWYNVNNPLLTGGLDAQTIDNRRFSIAKLLARNWH